MKENSKSRTRSRSTLTDVARLAGVSPSTVSSVLAGNADHRRISDETLQRVRSAANTLGYTPNLLHRSMRRGRTHVISLFNAFRVRKRGDLYMDRLAGAIEQAGGDVGYDILVHSNFKRGVKETYEFLNGGFSDGLILFGSTADEPLLPLLRSSTLPTVLIGPRHADLSLSTVMDDEAMGMRLIAEALIEHGHTEIAAVVERVGGVTDPTGRLRRLREELASRGVALNDRNVVIWNDSAAETARKLAALPSRPTAVFVWHDRNAYRIVEACEEQGIRIPQDLSVIGYDGIVWPSTSPHIVATVEVPVDEMAEVGVDLLDRLIQGQPGPLSITLPVRFRAGTTLGSNSSTHIQRRTHS